MRLNPERILGGAASLIFIVSVQAFIQGLLFAVNNGFGFQSFTDVQIIMGLLAPLYVFYGGLKLLQNPKQWVLLFGLAGLAFAAIKILFLCRAPSSPGSLFLPVSIGEITSMFIIGIGCIWLRRFYAKAA